MSLFCKLKFIYLHLIRHSLQIYIFKSGMIKFISLGSSSSGNCYYLATDNIQILVDAGIGVRCLKSSLKEKGIMLTDIDAVFITHDHADHIKAVGHLAHDYHLPIYATEEVHRGINRNYCVTTKLTPEHTRIINKSQTIELGDMMITAFSVPHDSSDCVGYRIATDREVFLIITDIGHATEIIQEEVSNADFIVIESNHDVDMLQKGPYPANLKLRILSNEGHLSNNACASELPNLLKSGTTRIVLGHISEENNTHLLARQTAKTMLSQIGAVDGVDYILETAKQKTVGVTVF